MRDRFWIGIILVVTYFGAFFLFTALSDMLAKTRGYYSQGISDDQNLKEEWR